jgi:hypothetical protein
MLALMLTVHLGCALKVEKKVPLNCDRQWDIGNSRMYNLAFEWTHESKLGHWEYEELENGCAHVKYETKIRIKKTFANLLPACVLRTKIDKMVCVQGDTLDESVVLTDVILIERMEINMRATIDRANRWITLIASTELSVPWFLKPFENTILVEIEGSFEEYQNLLTKSLCV